MDISSVILIGFFSILVFIVIYIAFYVMRDVIFFFCIQSLGKTNWFLTREQEQLVLQKLEGITYYKNLSNKGKRYFYSRVVVFMVNKHFFGDGIVMSDEVKVYISACAVEITFRIRGFYLDHIQLIRVFPHSVYSRLAQHTVKGLTLGTGVMWLSWQGIQEGFESQTDGINLGLHEMAHAFMLSITEEEHLFNFLNQRLYKWKTTSANEFQKLKEGDDSFFRKYGASNIDEFFAVSVECFFERPEEFANKFADIYSTLCRLFNQNPLNKINDYKLSVN